MKKMETALRKTLIAAVILATPYFAAAQSNVTVYGRFDISVNRLHYGSTATRAASSLSTLSSDASMIGFRGTEDLGGGLRAAFKIEHGLQLDTGTPTSTAFWNRESFVSVGSVDLGTLQLGSQWAPGQLFSIKVDPFQRFGAAGQVTLLQAPPNARGYAVMFNNAVQYISPVLAGVTARLIVAAGEGAATGKAVAGSVDYAQGPLALGAHYEKTRATTASVGLPAGGPVDSKTASVFATYDFGVLKLHGEYQTNRVERLDDVDAYLVGLTVPIDLGQVRASYINRSATNADAALYGVGYHYFLSKRTHLYSTLARLRNKGPAAAYKMGPAFGEQGPAGVNLPAAGQSTTGLQIGVRHFF